MPHVKFDINIKDLEWLGNKSYKTNKETYNMFAFNSGKTSISQVRIKGQTPFYQVNLDCLGVNDCEYCYSWKEIFKQMREGYQMS